MRNLSLARLKKYVDAYNIGADGVLEKDDLIERIISIRVSTTVSSYGAHFICKLSHVGEWMFAIHKRGTESLFIYS